MRNHEELHIRINVVHGDGIPYLVPYPPFAAPHGMASCRVAGGSGTEGGGQLGGSNRGGSNRGGSNRGEG